tara:strand:+ start:1536 stop:2354 length:819 start_codon:yes stop_codon:yes gene_type:complete
MELNKDIEDFDLVFLDLETTGLDVVTGDAICEIGAFKVRNREIIDKFHTLVNPKKNMPKQAYEVHKISDDDLKDAPFFEAIVNKLTNFLDNSVVCAYNVKFDIGFINDHLKDIHYASLSSPAIDILLMARDVLKIPRYNLETTAKYFGIDCSGGLHRAREDALIAYAIFLKLLDILKEKGINKLYEYVSLYGLDNEVFKIQESKKIAICREAIETETKLKVRYFSLANTIEEEKILPLRLMQENKFYHFLYQSQSEGAFRIKFNRVLDLEHI